MALTLDLIAHRGPDDSGVYADHAVTLGHRRLAILDLEHGHQPFVSADGRYVLVYNGEIYNYKELGERLRARGHTIRSRCDTEVLLHWLIEFGESALGELNGMFAFAFWDRERSSLLLARDRAGIKPLYVSEHDGVLIVGSEIKAMLPWLPRPEMDPATVFQYLTFQNVLDEGTFFRGVSKLLPGQFLIWSNGTTRVRRFWSFAVDRRMGPSAGEAVEAFRRVFEQAVERQMVSDVPLGSYLSSGIDSSSVATIAARHASGQLQTFIGAFADAPYYDERPGARAVAAAAGARLHEVEITPRHLVDLLPKVLWHLDEPTLGTGALPQYVVSRMVSEHVRVVLTGHGGDELFAGYQVNKAVLLRETARMNPFDLPTVLARVRRDEVTRILYFMVFPLLFPEVRHGLFIMTPRRDRIRSLNPDFLERAQKRDPFAILDSLVAGQPSGPADRLMFLYLTTYLPTLLIQEDKVGMAHSIEARMPLCDNEILDLALRLPLATKMFGGVLKAIPREAMRGVLPDMIHRLPKRGFPTPFARWFREEPARGFLDELLRAPAGRQRGIVDAKHAERLIARNAASPSDTLADYARANKLYAYGMVELWCRMFLDDDPVKRRHPRLACGIFAAGQEQMYVDTVVRTQQGDGK